MKTAHAASPGAETGIDPASVDDITLALARLAVHTQAEHIPDRACAAAKMALLDALGCAFAGHHAPGVDTVVELTRHWGGIEEAALWFQGTAVPAPAAAFANSALLHAMDFDDYHVPSGTHITSVLVPAVLAAAEANAASGRDTLAALVLGVEVVGRIGRACMARRDHEGFLPASVVGGFGAAAAACRLLGCTVEQTVNGLGIWYAHASGNRQALFDRTLTKRIQPAIAARAGVFAACLAAKDFTGPHRIIGGEPASLTHIFGYSGHGRDKGEPTVAEVMEPRAAWAVEELGYKQFACCGVSDNAIRAATALTTEHDLDIEQIRDVRVFGYCAVSPFGSVSWDNSATPHVLAQFCVPYATASALKHRCFGPDQIAPERIAADRDVDALARRVEMCDWSDELGPRQKGVTVVQAVLEDGRTLQASASGQARWQSPADDAEILAKFRRNAAFSGLLDGPGTERTITAIRDLDNCPDIGAFVRDHLGT